MKTNFAGFHLHRGQSLIEVRPAGKWLRAFIGLLNGRPISLSPTPSEAFRGVLSAFETSGTGMVGFRMAKRPSKSKLRIVPLVAAAKAFVGSLPPTPLNPTAQKPKRRKSSKAALKKLARSLAKQP